MKSRIKVLHACPRSTFSGLESWVLEMVKFQRANGVDSRLVALAESPLAVKARDAGVPVFEVTNPTYGSILRATEAIFDFDILHMHGTQEFKAAKAYLALRKWVRRRPVIAILQFHIWISHPKRDPIHALEYRLLDQIWCSSERARDSIINMLPINPTRVGIVHYGREIERLETGFMDRDSARAALKLPLAATLIGTVSRIDRGKGLRELIEGSLPYLNDTANIHLVIVGSVTTDKDAIEFDEELRRWMEGLPKSVLARIHMLGNVAESYRYLKAFDLFALLTYRECFSLALIEAQLAKLPCLVTDAGGSPELVRENQTGWLCEVRSIDSYRATLDRALADRGRWSSFGESAATRIRKEFDSNITLHDTITAYEKLLGRR